MSEEICKICDTIQTPCAWDDDVYGHICQDCYYKKWKTYPCRYCGEKPIETAYNPIHCKCLHSCQIYNICKQYNKNNHPHFKRVKFFDIWNYRNEINNPFINNDG